MPEALRRGGFWVFDRFCGVTPSGGKSCASSIEYLVEPISLE
jgi:hypothetical protein